MKKLSLMILAGFVAFSCAKDPAELGNGQTNAGVSITFSTGDYTQVGTRAMSESALSDVTVLEYQNGTLVKKVDLANIMLSQPVELKDANALVSLAPTTLDENGAITGTTPNVICFLANVNAFTGAPVTESDVNTYAKLLAYKLTLADAAALNAATYIPMTGFYYGGIVEGVSNQINASLTRSLARINFTLNTDNFKALDGKTPSIQVNSIELRNVPTTVTMFNANRPALPVNGANGIWPNGGGAAQHYPAVANAVLDATMNQTTGNKSTTFVAYMPENARGSYDAITSNLLKKPATISLTDDVIPTTPTASGLTYIFVDLNYTTSDGVIANATYKIYLGGNDKGDMNILGNTQYNVTTYLYGANKAADTRITFTPLFDPTVVTGFLATPQKNANSYIINSTPAAGSFILPLTQAKMGWSYISATLADQTRSDELDALIAGSDWEIITLWRTWGAGVGAADNITGVKTTGLSVNGGAENYFATLTFPVGIPAGNNAVIALQDKTTKAIYWSWHLWFTDYAPAATGSTATMGELHKYFGQSFTAAGFSNGKYIMDRNFGATHTGGPINAQPATMDEAVKTYGMMYQWGRKDPFTPALQGTSTMSLTNTVAIYDATGTRLTGTVNDVDGFPKINLASAATNNLAAAVQNPRNYYFSGLSNDWTMKDDNLWAKSSKTVFDPCPAGWRVPAGGTTDAAFNVWAGFSKNLPGNTDNFTEATLGDAGRDVFAWIAATGTTTQLLGTAGRMYDRSAAINNDASGVKAWYPASGNRSSASGAFYGVGADGYAWSGSVTGVGGYALNFGSTGVYPAGSGSRAAGFPVRCIQE